MKKFVLILLTLFCMSEISAFCVTTESSEFLTKQQSGIYNAPVKINVKKEHTEEYMQKIGETMIPAITYGYGDMKVKGKRKSRISYVTLLDDKCQIIWGCIIPR